MDAVSYTPSPKTLGRLKRVRFVAVVGPTAVGKTTLIREAMRREPSLHLVLNNTSRAPRPDEQEGVDYRFETRKAMEARIAKGEYVQVAPSLFGDLYATGANDYPIEGVAVLPVLADAMPVFRALPFADIRCVFLVPPDWDTWQTRIAKHKFTPEKLQGRLHEARRSLEFALTDTDLHYVISRDVAPSTDDFLTVVMQEPYSEALAADQATARGIIQGLLAKLKDA
jgi:guanylate kinase